MTYVNLISALADPTRRGLVERLASGSKSVGELAQGLPISRPAVSQHLRSLREGGLVEVEAQGTSRIYSLSPQALGELRAYIERMWANCLANLEDPAL